MFINLKTEHKEIQAKLGIFLKLRTTTILIIIQEFPEDHLRYTAGKNSLKSFAKNTAGHFL